MPPILSWARVISLARFSRSYFYNPGYFLLTKLYCQHCWEQCVEEQREKEQKGLEEEDDTLCVWKYWFS